MACSSKGYTPFAFYGLMFLCAYSAFFTAFLLHVCSTTKMSTKFDKLRLIHTYSYLKVDEVQDGLLTKCKYNI